MRWPNVYVTDHITYGRHLVLANGPSDESRLAMKNIPFQHLSLRGEGWTDLSLLHAYKDKFTGLSIWTPDITLSEIEGLDDLKVLIIDNINKPPPNLARLPGLVWLDFFWKKGKNAQSFFELTKLEYLDVKKWGGHNCNDYSNLTNLLHLKLTDCRNLSDLSGLERLKLCALGISGAKNLEVANRLSELETLVYLWIFSCPNISSYDFLLGLKNLEVLSVHDSSPFDNLSFLKRLLKLEYFNFPGTGVIDGELIELYRHESLKSVSFKNKKNFNITNKNVRGFLDNKWGHADVLQKVFNPAENILHRYRLND